MKKLFKDIAVAAVIGFAVGMLVALAAPAIATVALGSSAAAGSMGNPLFMGLFAGSWGAFGAAVTPAVSAIANKILQTSPQARSYSSDIAASSPVQTISDTMAVGLDVLPNDGFTQMIEAQKMRTPERGI